MDEIQQPLDSLDFRGKQNYELAFHINSGLEEAVINETKQAIEHEITSRGGIISFSKDPAKARLSYPIKHQSASYFGYVQFGTTDPETLTALDEYLRHNGNIIRSLILKLETDEQRQKSMAQAARTREKMEARQAAVKAKTKKESVKPESEKKVAEKEIEQQLEEVIEKL